MREAKAALTAGHVPEEVQDIILHEQELYEAKLQADKEIYEYNTRLNQWQVNNTSCDRALTQHEQEK
jgi:hypothetical protein